MFALPRESSSTKSRSARTARSTMPSACCGSAAFTAPKLVSIASENRVAPARPTMRNAPLTWCTLSAHGFSAAASPGAATNLAIASRTAFNAWSTSALIQERTIGFDMGGALTLRLRELEARYRVLQAGGELGQLRGGACRLLRALGGEL